jgi:carbamoyl-phosphate synthase small subunit
MKASLVLQDGTTFIGESFGYEVNTSAEVVFNTGMIGYPETLTDPSYKGQILVCTYPLIGNYWIPDFEIRDSFWVKKYFESDRIHLSWLVVSEYSENHNHFEASESLADFLKKEKIPAITGIDTRALTEYIREHGCIPGKIIIEWREDTETFSDPNERLLAYEVGTKEIISYKATENRKNKTLLIIDMWVKNNMLRHFLSLGVDIIRAPGEYSFMDGSLTFDGIFLSNGPGDPAKYILTIWEIRKAIEANKKIFGICLGNQLLALAWWATTYKLPYWHRGQNQPVKDLETNKCILTSQNHSFAIDESTLPEYIIPWMKNINDGTNEWIRFTDKDIWSVQFHPESSPWPHDSTYLFRDFVERL